MAAEFTAKTTNSKEAIYFLSLIYCSINKLKSNMLFNAKNRCFLILRGKIFFALQNGGGGGGGLAGAPCIPSFSTAMTEGLN